MPVPGGVLILEGDLVVGAIGPTGNVPDNDEACSITGVEHAGLQYEAEEKAFGRQ